MAAKKIIAFLIITALCSYIAYYLVHHPQEFNVLHQVSYFNLFLLLLSSFFYLLFQGLILNKAVEAFDIQLGVKEGLGILAITMLGNYIIPFSGIGFRAKYLKDVHQLAYKDFSTSLIAIFIVELIVFVGGGLLSLFYIYYATGRFESILITIMASALSGLLFILLFNIRLNNYNLKITNKIDSLLVSWYQVRANKKIMAKLFTYTLLLFLISAYMFYVAYHALGFNVSYFASLLPTALSDISFIIRLAPASLGTYESSIVYSSVIIGFTIVQGLLVVGIVRLTTAMWIFTCGPLFSYLLLPNYKKPLNAK